MHTVAAVLYPGALATSFTLPMEILHAASQLVSATSRGKSQVRFLLAGPDLQPMALAGGLVVEPDVAIDQIPALDLLLLPAIWRNPRPTIKAARPWLAKLPKIAASGTLICSVGTASTLLAEAGMLKNKPATTHWNYFEQFARRYPDVALKTHHLITQSDGIYCVGSVNSIADLMVHIVEEWFGGQVARAVENQFSPEIRRPFRAAAYQDQADSAHHDETILEAQQWVQAHLRGPISIEKLAKHLGLSTRTMNRRFKAATGMGAQAYLQSQRIATARDLLRHSNLSVSDICWQVGLQDVSYFSALFKRYCGISPLKYRRAVRGKLFATETSTVNR